MILWELSEPANETSRISGFAASTFQCRKLARFQVEDTELTNLPSRLSVFAAEPIVYRRRPLQPSRLLLRVLAGCTCADAEAAKLDPSCVCRLRNRPARRQRPNSRRDEMSSSRAESRRDLGQ